MVVVTGEKGRNHLKYVRRKKTQTKKKGGGGGNEIRMKKLLWAY